MSIRDVELLKESESRYLTYALSVVSGRALPDVRDGLKPVQRRILYAMAKDLKLHAEKHHRKSAAVVGEVLARYHPHGDQSCYDAMVRLSQDFSLRYPLVDGQGNFGSLDGDSAAAYRYTAARLTKLAIEIVGEIGEETVEFRENFDQTTEEPVVLPSRVPNLLINGASGIAVGMATSIPPHNLKEIIKGLQLLLKDPQVKNSRLFTAIKAPDFPIGCEIINTKKELSEIYSSGRGAVKMRGTWKKETLVRGKKQIVITSIPYSIDKSSLIAKIADHIISRKLPQVVDIRDESTAEVRIVMELAKGADPEIAMAYLYKNTPLQSNFNVNLTTLVPTENVFNSKPESLSLREMLIYFLDFRLEITRRKLEFEKKKLEEKIYLLSALLLVVDSLEEAIALIRSSSGRKDASEKLMKRFLLSESQACFVVDMRLYQLAGTAIAEVKKELAEKKKRVKQIKTILSSDGKLRDLISADLSRIGEEYGDARRCSVIHDAEELEFDAALYVEEEDVHFILTQDAWTKRIKHTQDPSNSRLREGDSIFFTSLANTRDLVAFISTDGNLFCTKVHEIISTSGYGEPVQKLFRLADGENVVAVFILRDGEDNSGKKLLIASKGGLGFLASGDKLQDTTKSGRKLAKLRAGDKLVSVDWCEHEWVLLISERGYGLAIRKEIVPELAGAGKGVILQRMSGGDSLVAAVPCSDETKVKLYLDNNREKIIRLRDIEGSERARRGGKLYRGKHLIREVEVI